MPSPTSFTFFLAVALVLPTTQSPGVFHVATLKRPRPQAERGGARSRIIGAPNCTAPPLPATAGRLDEARAMAAEKHVVDLQRQVEDLSQQVGRRPWWRWW